MRAIDLRSDSFTMPTNSMRDAMRNAIVGDDENINSDGRGSDPTVNTLEDKAAELMGKEAALLCTSGTMANLVALVTHCKRGESIAIEKNSHILRNDKSPFLENFFGFCKQEYSCVQPGIPEPGLFLEACSKSEVNLACIENSHSYWGGACAPLALFKTLYSVANRKNVAVHLDGARIFNAALYLGVQAKKIASCSDSVMFSLTRGVGAPFGALLCGSKIFIEKARETRKFIGGAMQQAGIMAAAGLVALNEGVDHLEEDHKNARMLGDALAQFNTCEVIPVETNIVMADIGKTGKTSEWFQQELALRGLLVRGVDNYLRMVTYRGISRMDIEKTITIFQKLINVNGLNK